MKAVLLVLMLGVLFIGVNLYAADGDLIVNGKIGIGTSNPAAKFEVLEPGQNLAGLRVNDGSSWLSVFPNLTAGAYNQLSQAGDIGLIFSDNSMNTGNLVIGPWAGSATGIRITSVGNVGIGTTSPQAKLQVEGSGFFRGDTGALSSSAGKGVRVFYATNYDAGSIFAYDYSGNTVKNLLIPYGNVAIGTTNPAGYKLYVSGSAYATSGWYSSDKKFKKDITPIDSALSKVLQINGVSFNWKTKDYAKKEFPEGKHYGVIAQDIEKVFPEVVKTVRFKYKDKEEDVEEDVEEKAVAYNELIPILIEAIKEQEQKIERLEATVAALTSKKIKRFAYAFVTKGHPKERGLPRPANDSIK